MSPSTKKDHLLATEGLNARSGRGEVQTCPVNVHLVADQPVVELFVETGVLHLQKKVIDIKAFLQGAYHANSIDRTIEILVQCHQHLDGAGDPVQKMYPDF